MITTPACPKGCQSQYKHPQYMSLKKDADGIAQTYECKICGHVVQLTQKEKIMEAIYGAEWFFGVPENCEVDEYFVEDEDDLVEKLQKIIVARGGE